MKKEIIQFLENMDEGGEGMISAALLAHLESLLESGKRVIVDYNKKTGTFYIGTTKMEKWEEMENE